ncbi:MAG: cytochrome-c peroxidase [bacterium]
MEMTKIALASAIALTTGTAMAAKYPTPDAVTDADFFANGSPDAAKIELGKFLFFDKELSGNRNIACATCHHTLTDTGDGLALPVGEGGNGLGIARGTGNGDDAIHARVPRNAPPVFNLGATAFSVMFWDGRLFEDPSQPSGFTNPAGDDLPAGLDNALSAQAMFPVQSGEEMAGQPGENTIADAAAIGNLAGPGGVWEQLAQRLQAIPEYVDLFQDAYPDITQASDITYVHAANAIGAYEATAFRATNSPFDQHLAGNSKAMSKDAKKGKKLFYGKAGCAECHSGKFQTDLSFHAIAVPTVGPGKGDGLNGHDDFGREQVTGDTADRYRFRTPTLRNVALTGPWGHSGAFNTLEGMVSHHLDAVESLENYDPSQLALPSRPDLDAIDLQVYNDFPSRDAIAAANELQPVNLSEKEFDQLMAFLHALTDTASIDIRAATPSRVPSGLPLAD